MKKKQILIGVCGSFCNHARVLEEFKKLTEDYDLHFVISEQVASTSTRFFEKSSFHQLLQSLSNTEIIKTICDSEPIGPRNIYDLMMIAPATATTIGKLANGIYDSSVTLAVKAMQRNSKPILIGLSSNDFIGITGANLLNYSRGKDIFLLPMYQDDIRQKPLSMTSCFELMKEGIEAALEGRQLQPIFREKKQ